MVGGTVHVSCRPFNQSRRQKSGSRDYLPIDSSTRLDNRRWPRSFSQILELVSERIPGHYSAHLLQLRPVWPDATNTSKFCLSVYREDGELRQIPWITSAHERCCGEV